MRAGRHISPGIIDCHSHMATDGGINEATQAITAEVRIGDFIDADDINIYRQLAGGVTSANILHGSANPIGGQNQVIKLRWGADGRTNEIHGAPPGLSSPWAKTSSKATASPPATRYPQSRMGVEQIIRDAFAGPAIIRAQWERWNASHDGLAAAARSGARCALAEILQKKRWVHCHSYRQDEILALIRTFDDFGITIGSLQHILEGYKVADAMAKHGATGSTFSDWWAYKFEVIDAIPFNGALMHRQRSSSRSTPTIEELARHLNHEAAKAIKYGGVPRRRGAQVRDAQSGQATADRPLGRLAGSGQARRFRRLVGRPARPPLAVRRNLDRWPQILRPRRRPGDPRRTSQNASRR